ncbi:MAG: enoyl-CoA hydratase [Actinomycetota bacterium]|nr:enoyl-CoA hydratase [Actinomycetota bacterium]
MPEFEAVNLDVADGVATIELNRPEALNAWNLQLGTDLREALEGVAADDSVRAVLLTGAGRAFSSGADLAETRDGVSDSVDDEGNFDLSKRLRERYHPIIHAVRDMPKPVVSAVNGPAAGIGCSLALSADLIVAGHSAYFLLAFVNIGLVPDGGSSAFVPARIGLARAAEMMMLGERVSADRALEWGLVNKVVPDGSLGGEARALAERLAKGPTRSYAGSKALLNRRLYADLDGQLEAEADLQREMGRSQDFLEGVTAFAQKRDPEFKGS